MGIQIDHNHRYTKEERDYLTSRGRGYLIPANERRFGTVEEPREPEEWEKENSNAISPFYQAEDREAAVYDVGGAPLPNTTLDYNTGRVADRENGVTVEYSGPGHVPGAYDLRGRREPEGFDSYAVDEQGNPVDDEIDDDIVEHVVAMPNVASLKKEIKDLKGEYDSDDKREELENKLAVLIQDLRDAGKDPLSGKQIPDGDGADHTGAGADGTKDEDEEDEEDETQE